MTITSVAWAPFRIPFVRPYETSRGSVSHREGFILRMGTVYGTTGLGEASLDPSSPVPAGTLALLIESLARSVVRADEDGLDAAMLPYLHGDEPARAVHCAFETAYLDANCLYVGVPLATMISGDGDKPPKNQPERWATLVNATIASRGLEDTLAAARTAVADGFVCIKVKAGMEESIEAEVVRVRAIRQAIGPDVELRLDANGAWSEPVAIATLKALEPFDIDVVEQPVPADDLDALHRVRIAVKMPVAADEAISDSQSAEQAVMRADALILKPMRVGGPTVVRYLVDLATAHGIAAVVTTTIDTGVATAMALQVVCALPDEGPPHGLATASLLEHDLLSSPLEIEAGIMHLPRAPGLGVTLDEAAAKKYLGPWREVR